MNPAADHFPACLPALDDLPGSGRVILAFSGGADSVCLAALLARADLQREITCIHVDHGLDPGSPERALSAGKVAAGLGLDCKVEKVVVEAGQGMEAGARKARYAVLADHLESGDVLLTAHHADDQAETVLMRLIRGSGPAGLAGIPRMRRFANGWLARPLLSWSRADIRTWLEQQKLEWIEDPANRDPAVDRNYITHEVMPAIQRRWPGAVESICRSARLSAGATSVLAEASLANFMRFSVSSQRLQRDSLDRLDDFRFAEMLRYWCHHHGRSAPPASRLEEFMEQLRTAGTDRQPELRWDESVIRACDQWLWLEPVDRLPDDWSQSWSGQETLTLPGRLGQLAINRHASTSDLALQVCLGRPGENILIENQPHAVKVRKLMYEAGIPPWHRDLWPRLWLDDRLVAVGDRWLDRDFRQQLSDRNEVLEWKTGLFRP